MKSGDRVRARPYGADEEIPPENILDWDPYDGPTEDLVGTLTILTVGGGDSLVPQYDQYLVDGKLADPKSVKPLGTTREMRARAAALAVQTFGQVHGRDGRFVGGGKAGGAKIKVGDRVRHVDGSKTGTVSRLVGRAGVGDGLHARIQWDDGGTSKVRPDLLVVLPKGLQAAGTAPMSDKGAQRHDPKTGRYVPKAGGSGGSGAKSGGSAAKKVAKKTGPTLTAEEKRAKQLEQLAEARRVAAKKRAEGTIKKADPAKANPKVLTDDPTNADVNFSGRLHKDTGWEKPVPVRDLTVANGGLMADGKGGYDVYPAYVVKNGYVFRVEGKVYLVETLTTVKDQTLIKQRAAEVAKHHHDMFKESVPKSLQGHQDGMVFLVGRNTADPVFARRYGVANFKSSATGGNGLTTVYNGYGHSGDFSKGSMLHELGHHIDYGHYTRGKLSESRSWDRAVTTDKEAAFDIMLNRGVRRTSRYEGHDPTPGTKAVTTYGAKARVEDYAESVRMYLTDIRTPGTMFMDRDGKPLRFSDLWPARASILAKDLGVTYPKRDAEGYVIS